MKTFGWDTVFVVTADRINALLQANSDKTVLTFDTTLPNLPNMKATGSFLPWQITNGGSNEIIHLKLTISDGKLSDGVANYRLAGLTLVIATYLHWIELKDQEDLNFGYNKLGEPGQPPHRGELSVIALRDPGQVLPPELNALLAYALGEYLVQHAGDVRFAFASVNLIPPTTNSWLTPKKNAYGYFLREGSDEAFLAIFSVVTNRDISNLQRTVDPAALPRDTNATYVISPELYLMNVIAPALSQAFNAGAGAFSYDTTEGVLRNNFRLWTKTVRSGLIDYQPWIDNLELRSGENALQGRYSGGVDMKAGIFMTYMISASNAACYADGALYFAPDPSPKETHEADIPWYWFFGGLIVIAVVEIVVKVLSDDIAAQIGNDNAERLAFGKYPPSSILWGGSHVIAVTSVGVNDAMFVRGNV